MRVSRHLVSLGVLFALLASASSALASSHREAPAIAEDQYVDNTDTYVFISPADPNRIVFVANYVPLLIPYSGPNFYKFSDNALYEIHVDNDGDAVADITYTFDFSSTVENDMTFLYNTGPVTTIDDTDLNVRQSYRLTRRDNDSGMTTVVGEGLPVAPWYVGNRTFASAAGYDTVANMAVRSSGTTRSFAGPRDEPFFVDLYVFDLLGLGRGFGATNGVNVMSIVLEVPITEVAMGGTRPAMAATGPSTVVGVHATASRPQVRILRRGRDQQHFGQFVQVSRLAWPLVNEVVIPLADKDNFNRSLPANDVTNFGAYILMPALPGLIEAVLGLDCATTPAGGRTDLVGFLSPAMTTPADLLRLDIRMGQTFAQSNFPNGRSLEDDVTDTALTVVCCVGGVGSCMPIGDGVDANDRAFQMTFPYLPPPAAGAP